ncbi:scavenger receptor cysteine-rich domain-containing protein DMBT1-like [Pelodiscus sinensis]|uniref:scavenger receptor cysteine-rich domain-containing protein DMBT1-like n=1 Tax=Pelodiscus sinensis TaxID=13735 RepID=UPI003F6D8C8D
MLLALDRGTKEPLARAAMDLRLGLWLCFAAGVGVSAPSDVRLVGGPHGCAGRVEVLVAGRWGTVCDDGWDEKDVAVVCRQLGCGQAVESLSSSVFGPGSESQPVLLTDVQCQGTEAALGTCTYTDAGHHCEHDEDAGVRCQDVRLVGGPHGCAGRVEVLVAGRWGTVCDDGWDEKDVAVVCRQLGCGQAVGATNSSVFGPGPESQPVLMMDVQCQGTEAALGTCTYKHAENLCEHFEDVGARCQEVRLVGGPHGCAGRVEVLVAGRWGTVCDDGWDEKDVAVVCRQLGCGQAVGATNSSVFGPGPESQPVLLMDVQCQGTEAALGTCTYKHAENLCEHFEDVGARCQDRDVLRQKRLRRTPHNAGPPALDRTAAAGVGVSALSDVRLVGGPHSCAGRVEVLVDGRWGTVCDDDWDEKDVAVVCRQLGCGQAMEALSSGVFGPGSESQPILLTDVQCQGTEAALGNCTYEDPGIDCNHNEDAGARCQDVRLVGGAHSCAGRVEVLVDGRWGTVCDDGWDEKDVAVVCRQLGCGQAVGATNSRVIGPGPKSQPVLLMDVQCQGTEAALRNCTYKDPGGNCDHREDAEAHCQDVRLVGGPHSCAGQVEVLVDGRWGTVCDDSWDEKDVAVVCRRLGCGQALEVTNSSVFSPGPKSQPVLLTDVQCWRTEAALETCTYEVPGDNCDYVGARCQAASVEVSAPSDVRLVGGPHGCAGRVEVLVAERWGTVCDDGWDEKDAAVVCRQLGCGQAMEALSSGVFGPGPESQPILLTDVQCQGTEAALGTCTYEDSGIVCEHKEDAGARCQDIRLVGGPHSCAGRVEVLVAGRWGTVCDDDWDERDVAVVCRQLGCGQAMEALHSSVFGPGSESQPILLTDVQCQGTEAALGNCTYEDSGIVCEHKEDAGARCQDVRLVGGPHSCAGRVEVLVAGRWGTVCDDGWDEKDVAVVCRQLGCGQAVGATNSSVFGPGPESQPVLLTDVQCQGTEAALGTCTYEDSGIVCDHKEDAGARCQASGVGVSALSDIRLVGGPHGCAGRVEVLVAGRWGTVCDDDWDEKDVAVVCRQLGCGQALEVLSSGVFGPGSESQPILLTDVQCQGTEAALGTCTYEDSGIVCDHNEDAGARCQAAGVGVSAPSDVRLVGGPHSCAGRVEVLVAGHWGTVCDDGWDEKDVAVVCRQLGCGQAVESLSSSVFGPGSESQPVLLTDVQCQGTEAALGNCTYEDSGIVCEHKEDAGARCQEVPKVPVRLVGSNATRCSGQVEIFHQGRWGTVCGLGWDLRDAKVLCRELGCGSPRYITQSCSKFSRSSEPILLGLLDCTGHETSLTQCQFQDWAEKPCPHPWDTGVTCQEPFALRLVDGPGRCAGRLEVQYDGEWGTVCDDHWSNFSANVVCRELGCGLAEPVAPKLRDRPRFGKATGRIWLDDVRCKGTEKTLQNCAHHVWGYHDCTHHEDISVVCQES